jgi:hypothetical protein
MAVEDDERPATLVPTELGIANVSRVFRMRTRVQKPDRGLRLDNFNSN